MKNLTANFSKWDPLTVLFPLKKSLQKHDQMWLVLIILFNTQIRYTVGRGGGGGFDERIKGFAGWVGFFYFIFIKSL